MVVRFSRSQLAYFRNKAKKKFPNEIFAELFGIKLNQNLIEVHRFGYPKLDVSNSDEVIVNQKSLDLLYAQAEKDGLVSLGDIHSHPDWTPVLSKCDHKGHIHNGNTVSAILSVRENDTLRFKLKDGKTSHLVVWQSHTALPATIEYY